MTHAPQGALFRGDGFFLLLDAGFFVMFTFSKLGKNTGLFTQLLESPNGALDGFVFSYSDSGHKIQSPPIQTPDHK